MLFRLLMVFNSAFQSRAFFLQILPSWHKYPRSSTFPTRTVDSIPNLFHIQIRAKHFGPLQGLLSYNLGSRATCSLLQEIPPLNKYVFSFNWSPCFSSFFFSPGIMQIKNVQYTAVMAIVSWVAVYYDWHIVSYCDCPAEANPARGSKYKDKESSVAVQETCAGTLFGSDHGVVWSRHAAQRMIDNMIKYE